MDSAGLGAANVIPDTVEMLGTIRALTGQGFASLRRRVTEVAEAVSESHGCNATVQWSDRPYGPTTNDAKMVALVNQ